MDDGHRVEGEVAPDHSGGDGEGVVSQRLTVQAEPHLHPQTRRHGAGYDHSERQAAAQ